VKVLWYASIAVVTCVSFAAHAESLDEIATFAQKICNQSLSGGETSTTIAANLNGDVNGLAKALGISVGAGGLVKKDGNHYEGIPEKKLPNSIPTPAQCKLELAKVLIEERRRLGDARPTKFTPRVSDEPFDKQWRLKTKTSNSPSAAACVGTWGIANGEFSCPYRCSHPGSFGDGPFSKPFDRSGQCHASFDSRANEIRIDYHSPSDGRMGALNCTYEGKVRGDYMNGTVQCDIAAGPFPASVEWSAEQQ